MSENSYLDDLNLSDYQEPQAFAEGSQVTFRVIDAEQQEGEGEKGKWANLQLVLQAQEWDGATEHLTGKDVTNPKVVYFPIWLDASKGADVKKRQSALGSMSRAYKAIGEFPADGTPSKTDFFGKEITAIVKVNERGELPRNDVKRLIYPD